MKFLSKLICVLSVMFCVSVAKADPDPIRKVSQPIEVKNETSDPSLIEGLQWNRWTSKNFTVLCLNDTQAQYLHRHLELVKSWTLSRWGLYDIDFSAECRLICVDDPALFKKLFNLTESKVEIRRDANNKVQMSVIFLLINDLPSRTVPIPLSKVCLAEFSQKYGVNFPLWAVCGMGELNGSIDQIKQTIAGLQGPLSNNSPMYFSKGLMEMTSEQYQRESAERRAMYDMNAAAMCLMVRKEFGENRFQWLLKRCADGMPPEQAVQETLKFSSFAQFDASFKRYMEDLSRDVASGKTPNKYLQITANSK